MPQFGTHLIDLDKDLIFYVNRKTYKWLWRIHEGMDYHYGRRCVFMMTDPSLIIHGVCLVAKWPEWFEDFKNLKDLCGSFATVFGLENDEPIIDVQPLLTTQLQSNIERIVCPADAAYLPAK